MYCAANRGQKGHGATLFHDGDEEASPTVRKSIDLSPGIVAREPARQAVQRWLCGHLRDDSGDIWTRAANYHSRTPRNTIYRAKLIHKAVKWEKWLQARFVTIDLSSDKQLPATARTPAAGGTSATAALHGSQYGPRAIAAAGH